MPDVSSEPDSGGELPMDGESNNDKPFDDTPFDAGVEASEEDDPKTYIQQLSGKLGQSLRKYTDETGQPDLELEKFAINSVISATHTADMDENDKKDIIAKVNSSGNENDNEESNDNINLDDASGDTSLPSEPEENSEEIKLENFEVYDKDRKSLFADATLGVDQIEETVQDIYKKFLKEDFDTGVESDIFVNNDTDMIDTQPVPAKPAKPATAPERRTKRKDKPFQIPVRPQVNPEPKAAK